MNIFDNINTQIKRFCESELGVSDEKLLSNIVCEPPKNETHGDIATNVAMVLAKPLKNNPREIAAKVKEFLDSQEFVEKAEIAGPGFINLNISKSIWFEVLKNCLSNPENYGKCDLGNAEKINVEYVSANPTGPMHIGHARNAVVGDALANLLKFAGYDVVKEYYINDAGAQVEVLAKSAFLRYREALGEDIGEIPEGLYPGEYLIEVGQKLKEKYKDKLSDFEQAKDEIKNFTIDEMMAMIKQDLSLVGVEHDIFSSEKKYNEDGLIEKCLGYLEKKQLTYNGILEAPKGRQPEDWEPREQILFKSSEFGDDTDRPLKKSDGSNTYFTGDIAYHYDKYKRGFNKMVIVLGADHGGYVKRLKAAVKALSGGEANIEVLLSQLVKLVENGVELKMSKRAGTFITLKEVVEKVGKDVLRFIMLTRKSDQTIDFDLAKVLESTKDNPVFYVQYASARISSVLRSAKEKFDLEPNANENFEALTHEKEIKLIRKIAEFPRLIESAAKFYEPHRVTFYLNELASEFHSLWNLGKDEGLKMIDESDLKLTRARISLIQACKNSIKNGLKILGVEALEKM